MGQQREWRTPRHVLTPEAALGVVFQKLCERAVAPTDIVGLALPHYLSTPQMVAVAEAAGKAGLALKGVVAAALALVADRAAAVLAGRTDAPESDEAVALPDWVVPLRPAAAGPGAVVVLDADEHALSGAVVAVAPDEARVLATAAWPRLGLKAWEDRLIDAVADRCVRLCRRDPRDSADAEQALFEQLDDALDRLWAGQRATLTVRTAHWYQDVVQQPDDFDAYCVGLTKLAAEGLRELMDATGLPVPPRAVWLTHAAGRLPGLCKAVHAHTAECTAVEVLPPRAAAAGGRRAAASLAGRRVAAGADRRVAAAGEERPGRDTSVRAGSVSDG